MIAAVFDSRGGEVAEERLRELFVAGGDSLSIVARSGFCSLGGDAACTSPATGLLYHGDVRGDVPRPVELDSVVRLRGCFALTAAHTHGLLLHRSRWGGRALFYATDETAVIACTSLKPLLRVLGDNRVNVDALASILSGVAAGDVDETVFRRIRRVRSGEAVLVAPAGLRRSIRAAAPTHRVESGSIDELAEELRARIYRSVERAVAGAHRVVVAAGGGLDSSVLLATVARACGEVNRSFDVVALDFAGPGDDRPHMRALQTALGIEVIRSAPENGGALMRHALVLDGAPCPYPNVGWWLHTMRAARERGADVMLTGEGGDEVLGGDLSMFAREARSGAFVHALIAAARLRAPWKASSRRRVEQLLLRPLLRELSPVAWRRRRRVAAGLGALPWAGGNTRRWIEDHAGDEIGYFDRPLADELERNGGWAHAAEMRSQLEVAGGLTRVDPFLDPDVAEFATRVPARAHFCDNYHRGLLRRAARGLVPDTLRFRSDKAGFEPAMLRSLQAAGGNAAFEDLADARYAADLGLVEPPAFAAAFERLRRDPTDGALWMRVWPTLAVEQFLRSVNSGDIMHV